MYPDQAFQARVDVAIGLLEAEKGGAVCPLRRIPLDMIAEVVAQDLGVTSAMAGTLVTDGAVLTAARALLGRFLQDPAAKPPSTTSLALEETLAVAPPPYSPDYVADFVDIENILENWLRGKYEYEPRDLRAVVEEILDLFHDRTTLT